MMKKMHLKLNSQIKMLQNIRLVLEEMNTLSFSAIVQKEGGTQFKLIVDFPNGGQALFKPMRFPREQVLLSKNPLKISIKRRLNEALCF